MKKNINKNHCSKNNTKRNSIRIDKIMILRHLWGLFGVVGTVLPSLYILCSLFSLLCSHFSFFIFPFLLISDFYRKSSDWRWWPISWPFVMEVVAQCSVCFDSCFFCVAPMLHTTALLLSVNVVQLLCLDTLKLFTAKATINCPTEHLNIAIFPSFFLELNQIIRISLSTLFSVP